MKSARAKLFLEGVSSVDVGKSPFCSGFILSCLSMGKLNLTSVSLLYSFTAVQKIAELKADIGMGPILNEGENKSVRGSKCTYTAHRNRNTQATERRAGKCKLLETKKRQQG